MLVTVWESRWLPDFYGGVAQLGEHLPCKQGVESSNLFVSTVNKETCLQVRKKLYLENRITKMILIKTMIRHPRASTKVDAKEAIKKKQSG